MCKDRCVDTCTRMYAYASMRAHTLGCMCHVHRMYGCVCTQVQYAKELAAAQQQLVDDCGNLQLLLKDEKQRREREAQEVIRMSTMAKSTY